MQSELGLMGTRQVTLSPFNMIGPFLKSSFCHSSRISTISVGNRVTVLGKSLFAILKLLNYCLQCIDYLAIIVKEVTHGNKGQYVTSSFFQNYSRRCHGL